MNWRAGLLVFALCWAAYLGNCRTLPYASGGDTIPSRLIPFSLLRDRTLRLDMFREDIYKPARVFSISERDGSLISIYPVGTSLAVLPVYVPVYALLAVGGKPSPHILFEISEYVEKLASATLTAFAVWIFWLTIRRTLPPRQAFWIAIAFGLGTSMWAISSQMLWQQSVVSAFVTIALWLLTWPGFPRWAAAGAGFALSMAFAARPTAALFVLAGFIATIVMARRSWLQYALAFGIAALPLVAFALFVNIHYWGHAAGFYERYVGATFHSVFTTWGLRGTHALLLSPNRGLLIFTPIALIGILGLALQLFDRKARNPVLLCFGLASLAHFLICGAFEQWWAGWAFGPRYLTDILPILALAGASIWNRLPSWSHRAAVVLLVWSIFVQFNGAFCYPASQWNGRMIGADTVTSSYSWEHFELWEDFVAWRRLGTWSAPW
jgi:hypothetical protein